jgi:Leucine-rich repeat (LRR) protein
MNGMLSSRKRHHITRVGLFVLIVALIVETTGCVGEASRTVKYDLTIASGEGGSVTDPGEGMFKCDTGRVLELVATPTSGYRFAKWTGAVGTIANVNAASTTITVNGNYSIRANFEETEATFYTLTLGVAGSGSTNPPAGQHTYAAGAVVSIIATPATGYRFVSWTGDVGSVANVNAVSTTITMNDNCHVTANFEQTGGTYFTLTMAATGGGSINPAVGQHSYATGTVVPIVASAAGGYYFVNWTGNVATVANVNSASTTITMSGNYSITANFGVIPSGQCSLTISSTAGGSVTVPGQGTFTYGAGTVVNLVAGAASGYAFVSWTGNVGTIANVNSISTTITMNGNYSITANFGASPPLPPGQYSLTISSTAGGSVTSPGQGTFAYWAGTVVNLVAAPVSGYRFVGWTGNVSTVANVSAASTTITMNSNYSITATFAVIPPGQYGLTISSTAGGWVTTPGQGTFTYGAGTVVNLVAAAVGGYRFVNWTGNVGTVANVSAASTTITMNSNYSITANFAVIPPVQYSLTISSTAGGSVTLPGQGTFTYGAGMVVNLVAAAVGGYRFVNWTGNVGTIANVNAASTTITMSGNYSIIANFAVIPPIQYSLTISSTAGGSVTTPGQGIFPYGAGTVVNLVAAAAGGYRFMNWTGNVGTVANVTAASTTITMSGNYSITANFAEIPQYRLTTSSTAGGSVTSPGEGTFTYYGGTVVNLAATPAGGYAFVNWTGNVGAIANVNAAYTTVTMNGNYSITANFELGDWVFFPDPALEAALREAIGRPTGRIYESDLEGLTSLSATGKDITDLTGLEHCISLISLDLHNNEISDISSLASLTKLEWLDLSDNRISNISPLAGLINLKWLYLYDNRIGNISPLANLTNVLYLYLHLNQISNISPLANLTNLTSLLLSFNQIGDISPVTNLTKLTWLYLDNNQISNIVPLTNLTHLTQLGLSDNQISGIAPLAGLTDLIYLSLHSNEVSNISFLASLTNLMWLYLHNNLIVDIHPLVENGGLGPGDIVSLSSNPLSDDSINIYIPELVARGVIVSY